MILLNDFIEVLTGSYLDVAPARMLSPQPPLRASTGDVSVERHFARYTRSVRRERLAKEGLCSGDSAIAAKQEVNCAGLQPAHISCFSPIEPQRPLLSAAIWARLQDFPPYRVARQRWEVSFAITATMQRPS